MKKKKKNYFFTSKKIDSLSLHNSLITLLCAQRFKNKMDSLIGQLKSTHLEDDATVQQPKIIGTYQDLKIEYKSDINGSTVLALDCEGVDLGRDGSITIITMSTENSCYLFDVIDLRAGLKSELKAFLKDILEDEHVTKIIHDCKMDSDALLHSLGIMLAGVHDTQAWDDIIRKNGEKNLNDTLLGNGCETNPTHNTNVYKVKA